MGTPATRPTTYFGLPLQAYLQLHNLNSESFGRHIREGDSSKPARTWTERTRRLFKGLNSPYISIETHEPLSEKLAKLYGISVFKLFPLKYYNRPKDYYVYWQELVLELRGRGIAIPDVAIEIKAKAKKTKKFENFHTLFGEMLREEFKFYGRSGAGYRSQAAKKLGCKVAKLKDFIFGQTRPDKNWFLETIQADGIPTTRLEIIQKFQSWPKYRAQFYQFYNQFYESNVGVANTAYQRLNLDPKDVRAIFRNLISAVFGTYDLAGQQLGHGRRVIESIIGGHKPLSQYYLSDKNKLGTCRIAILVEHTLRVKDPTSRVKAMDLLKTLGDAYAQLPIGLKRKGVVLLTSDQVSDMIAQLDDRGKKWRAAVVEVVTNIIECYAASHNDTNAWDDEASALAEMISNESARKQLHSILVGENEKAQNYVFVVEAVVKAYALFHNYSREILGRPSLPTTADPANAFSRTLAELCRKLGALVPEVRNLVPPELARNAFSR